LLTAVQLADVRELGRADGEESSAKREALFSRRVADLNLLSETLTRTYFIHAMQSRQLAAS
jgi:hypothetical protein